MKNRIVIVALLAALALLALGFTYQAAQPKWDYKAVTMRADGDDAFDTDFLTSNGSLGWELVTVERGPKGRTYFFKRPR